MEFLNGSCYLTSFDCDVRISRNFLLLVALEISLLLFSLLLFDIDAAKVPNLVKDHDYHLIKCILMVSKITYCYIIVESQFFLVFLLKGNV